MVTIRGAARYAADDTVRDGPSAVLWYYRYKQCQAIRWQHEDGLSLQVPRLQSAAKAVPASPDYARSVSAEFEDRSRCPRLRVFFFLEQGEGVAREPGDHPALGRSLLTV